MDITPQTLQALFTAVSTAFNQGRNTYTATGDRIATEIPSTSSQNDYSWLGEFKRLREWIGERQIEKAKVYSYAIKNKKFEATEGIPAEYIEDDQYGILMPKFQDMGYAAATHPDELIYALLAAGFTTPCYDGQNFFDTDHPVGEEGQEVSVSNMQAGSGNPWFVLDTRRPIKPLIKQKRRDYRLQAKTDAGNSDHVFMHDEYLYGVDARLNVGFGFWQMAFASMAELNDDNLDAGISSMMSVKSDKGRPLGVMPDLLVVGPSNRAKARKIIEAAQKVGGESNTNYKALDLLVVPWLA
ncbi:Mu-like prophage major head subunit gpT family protein [Alkalimonas mucilaginosa]|uniref:Mu-like prophage major head subunit gpT family protein n=1 Tax=Alkalimonas mucilaginosa TaxID=3057676 RepID=A0ABU7JH71_9GAMM|nr:Mu-like prophage major head subunit gpT family protein [Alkalimonas sp. MEB004]MEE2025033.1 Mu-like prophage major head subunit gpT family protein [Alkalimonas sp. MEB004]